MKKREAYKLTINEDFTEFRFTSIGPKGNIPKIVVFKYFGGNIYNLGFGDVVENDWDDKVITDNKDMRKVVQTVANAVHIYFDNYPDREIMIWPVDRKRKLLYNRVFKEKAEEIDLFFHVAGLDFKNSINEKYDPSYIYDAFVLKNKTRIFEK
ncbi:MAG TPA: hypothetical protein ENJ95_08720 [Bacteroidetes bacterium]|nr:hypothetical protein [Bacteroidota bacterium]